MKTTSLLTAIIVFASAAGSFAADEAAAKEGCKMMPKKEPAPEPSCCCQKMMAKPEESAKAADLNALVEKMKTAKGDQVLDAFAAVLNKVLAERKAASTDTPEASAPAPAEHHH